MFSQNEIIQLLEEKIHHINMSGYQLDYLNEVAVFESAINEIKTLSSKCEDLLTSLRYASGIISTMPQYATMHPEDVFNYLVLLYKELLYPPQ